MSIVIHFSACKMIITRMGFHLCFHYAFFNNLSRMYLQFFPLDMRGDYFMLVSSNTPGSLVPVDIVNTMIHWLFLLFCCIEQTL